MSVDNFAPKIISVEEYSTDITVDGGVNADVTGTRITVSLSNSSPPSGQAMADSLDTHFGGEDWRSSTSYEHIESLPESTWTVNHNLDRNPGLITVFDQDGGQVMFESIQHTTTNSLTISFLVAQSGRAYLS